MHPLQTCSLKTLLCLACYYALLLPSAHVAAAQAATNTVPLPKQFMDPQTAWGEATNGLRAGVSWFEFSGKKEIRTTVLSFNTNVAWNYVTPPGKKFLKCELRDAHGVLLTPRKGKKLDGELPQRILTKDLPYRPASGIHHRRTLDNWFLIGNGLPTILRDFFIEDVFRIEQEGDYTLTVGVAIYEFAPDRESVARIDLPPVTTKIHLRSAITPEGTSSGMVAAYVAGAALCVGGMLWLVAHRRRHNAGDACPRTAPHIAA